MKRNNLLRFVLSTVVLIWIIQFSSAVNDFDSYKPYLHKASVGDVPKLQTFGEYRTQLFQGAGTYSYTIDVPPGTNGLPPSVALRYNSQANQQNKISRF